jgi:hypothetical protein
MSDDRVRRSMAVTKLLYYTRSRRRVFVAGECGLLVSAAVRDRRRRLFAGWVRRSGAGCSHRPGSCAPIFATALRQGAEAAEITPTTIVSSVSATVMLSCVPGVGRGAGQDRAEVADVVIRARAWRVPPWVPMPCADCRSSSVRHAVQRSGGVRVAVGRVPGWQPCSLRWQSIPRRPARSRSSI